MKRGWCRWEAGGEGDEEGEEGEDEEKGLIGLRIVKQSEDDADCCGKGKALGDSIFDSRRMEEGCWNGSGGS